MTRTHRSIVIVAAALALGTSGARGQDIADIDYEYLSFRGVAFEYGYLWPDRVKNTPSYGVRFDLGYAGPGLRVVPSIMYWSAPLNGEEIVEFQNRVEDLVVAQNGGVRPALDLGGIDYTDIAFGLDVQVVWELPLDVLTFGGLGVSAHVMDGDGAVINGTFVEDLLDSVEPGFNLHVGTEYPIAENMRLYTNGRYEVMPDLQYLQVRVGWQFMWGPNAPGEGRGSN